MTRVRPSDAVDIRHGDALDVLRGLPDESVEAFITDPPYGLSQEPDMAEVLTHWLAGDDYTHRGSGFMGRSWDSFVPGPAVWREAYRVLKPGGHLLCFAGTRTSDLMGISIRLAGFEIRDRIRCETTSAVLPAELAWEYGSGFPKSLDVGKAIDKAGGGSPEDQARVLRESRERSGMSREQVAAAIGCTPSSVRDWEEGRARATGRAVEFIVPSPEYRDRLADLLGYSMDEREIVGATIDRRSDGTVIGLGHSGVRYGEARTAEARRWDGWGTALKPAYEPIIVARKPLAGTVAANVLTHGTGALNIAATRVPGPAWSFTHGPKTGRSAGILGEPAAREGTVESNPAGRWPSNVVLVHGEGCVPVGTRKVRGTPGGSTRDGIGVLKYSGTNARPQHADDGGETERPGYANEDGTETVEAWECVEGCPVAEMDAQSGNVRSSGVYDGDGSRRPGTWSTDFGGGHRPAVMYGDRGGASRFFPTFRYQAKADGSERPSYIGPVCHSDGGCSQITDEMHPSAWPEWARDPKGVCPECGTPCGSIMHPTVKPLELARWLVRLVLAKGGTFIDPYVGSGTFAEAAILEGVNAVVVDKVGAHIPLIEQRVKKYDDPLAMAAARRGDKVATRVKSHRATAEDGDEYDLFAGWAS